MSVGVLGIEVSVGIGVADGVGGSEATTPGVQAVNARHIAKKSGTTLLDMRPIIASLTEPEILPETKFPIHRFTRDVIADAKNPERSLPFSGGESLRDDRARQPEPRAVMRNGTQAEGPVHRAERVE